MVAAPRMSPTTSRLARLIVSYYDIDVSRSCFTDYDPVPSE
jgi:hypothetical protein